MIEERLLEDFSRMNNELINARRELVRVNAVLEGKERFLERVLALSPDTVYVYDLVRGRYEYRSRDVAEDLGWGPEERARGGFTEELMHPEDRERFPGHLRELAAAPEGGTAVFEYRLRDSQGAWRWFRSRGSVFDRDPAGAVVRVIGISTDIGAEKAREDALLEASLVDPLTGLRNRRGFEELAGQQLRVASRRGSPCALLYLDLDRFKAINDGWGHAEGDEALKATARLLEACFRAEDILARQGGDEFAAMLSDSGEAAVLRLVERLEASTEAWNAGSGKPWRLGFSAGWVLFDPRNPVGLPELLSLADAAMYRAKRGGP